MVFGLLKEPYRKALFARATAASSRRARHMIWRACHAII